MRKCKLSKTLINEATVLSEANQIKYVIFKDNVGFDYCSLAEWNLVFEHLPGYARVKTIAPTQKTDYDSVVMSAQQMLFRHSDLYKDFEIIEFKENQFTYKLIKK